MVTDHEMRMEALRLFEENEKLVTELKLIADWRKVNLAGEYEHSLRDIIRSMLDCADRGLALSHRGDK